MTYKIEGLVQGQWDVDGVGGSSEDNRFDTEEEAEAMIPALAKIFHCEVNEFRVRVIES